MDDLLQEMIDPTPEPGDRPRRRRLIATIAIVGLAIVGITSLTTGALFTDREQTDDGFKTGTVDLTVGDLSFPTSLSENLVPGSVTCSAIQVNDTGSLGLRYAVTYTATQTPAGSGIDDGTEMPGDAGTSGATGGDVRSALQLAVYKVSGPDACDGVGPGSEVPAGTELYAPTHLATSDAAQPLLGKEASGAQPGDRPLTAGGSEFLAFVVSMDKSAGNDLQEARAQLTLDFYAEQTANNP